MMKSKISIGDFSVHCLPLIDNRAVVSVPLFIQLSTTWKGFGSPVLAIRYSSEMEIDWYLKWCSSRGEVNLLQGILLIDTARKSLWESSGVLPKNGELNHSLNTKPRSGATAPVRSRLICVKSSF